MNLILPSAQIGSKFSSSASSSEDFLSEFDESFEYDDLIHFSETKIDEKEAQMI